MIPLIILILIVWMIWLVVDSRRELESHALMVEGRDKAEEEVRRRKGFDGAKTFWTDLIWNPKDDIFSDFIGSCQDISSYSARLIYIIDNASRVVVLNCYDRGQWGFDDLYQQSREYFNDEEDWYSSWYSKDRKSQIFKTKKAALMAWAAKEIWFDFNLESLDAVKASLGNGEILKVRYWGGRRSGKDRYVSITDLNQMTAIEPDEVEIWYAEVKEIDTGDVKTYRVDRMQIVPSNPRELLLESLEDA